MRMFGYSSNSGDKKLWSEQPSSGFMPMMEGDMFLSEEKLPGLQVRMRWFGGSRPNFCLEVGGERAEEFVRLLTAYWNQEEDPGVSGFVQVFAWFGASWQNPFWDDLLKMAREMESPF